MKNILVFGATGPQGRPVAERLLAKGYRVRALVRDMAKAQPLASMGIELVAGDLDDPMSVTAAMRDQDGVFLLVPFSTGRLEHATTVIDAAVAGGIRSIVWNATGTIPPAPTGNPAIDMRRGILAALEASGIPFVALQPTTYMENFLIPIVADEVAGKDTLAYPIPEAVRCQWISQIDAASFAVAAFSRPDAENLVVEISGPEKLSGSEIAERFSRGLNRAIRFRPMPPKEFGAALEFGGGEALVTSYYEQVFANPEIMTTHVDHERAMRLLPIVPTFMEDFAGLHRDVLSR
ncbi:MAG TPA: NmrA family NAD(P)-binding protein [Devosia sp.]